MKLKVMFIIISSALITACSSSSGGSGAGAGASTAPAEIDAAKAKQIAGAAVPGTLSEPTLLDEEDEHRWVVEVALAGANGAAVQVEITRTTGVLEEVASVRGPFDYDLVAPSPGLMTFAQAKAKAFATKKGVVEAWEVKPPENQYEVYVRDVDEHLWEIKMTADKGDITSVIEKAKAD